MNKHLPTYFADFLQEIRPTADEVADFKAAHETLRERLLEDATLGPIIVSTFLQGSYRRATLIRPQSGKSSDVDVVVVTRLSEAEYTPQRALTVFKPFLDAHYPDQWQLNGRSIGITLDNIDMDLVVTSAPSESQEELLKSASVYTSDSIEDAADWRLSSEWLPIHKRQGSDSWVSRAVEDEQWRSEPLRIPDRDAACWQDTHPLEQIRWTQEKNRDCNTHYVNVVKAIKWWRRLRHVTPKYPKGYPVEHLIGVCCPDDLYSVAEGVVLTLEGIARDYQPYADTSTVPVLPDHGVPDHDVFKRITGEDFAHFHQQVGDAAVIARAAFNEEEDLEAKVEGWKKLFGDAFDPSDDDGGNKSRVGGFTQRSGVTRLGSGRFG